MCNVAGAKAGVGFTDKVIVTTESGGGIYYFDKMFFSFLSSEIYSIERCCELALIATEVKYDREQPFGTGNYITYGEIEY